MIIYKKVIDISIFLEAKRAENYKIGFIPTMGALHKGHLSLITDSKNENCFTVCSIFVNPTQFNDKSDFEKYPITIEADIALLETIGCDVLFLPSVEEIYPDNNKQHYPLGEIENILEGKYRPGHFQGVCQVVSRLLDIIKPALVYLGQKDYQQCMVIMKLTELKRIDSQIVICPTEREITGLAMSSRNVRLSTEGKASAISIYQSLLYIKENINLYSIEFLKEQVKDGLIKNGFSPIDYIEICNAKTLETITDFNPSNSTVVLIAAFIEGVRLIDNMLIS